MKQSDLNHLRRLLGWVRCDIGQDPAGQQQTMIHIAGKLDIDSIDADAKARLVEGYRRAEAVPVYVRDAVKALEKALAAAGRGPGAAAPRATAETRANTGFTPGVDAGREPVLDDVQIERGLAEIGVYVWGQRGEDWLAGAEYAARILRGSEANPAVWPVACRDTPAAPPPLRRDDTGGAGEARQSAPVHRAQGVQAGHETAGQAESCRQAITLQVMQEALRLMPSDEARRVAREVETRSGKVTPDQYVGAGAVAVIAKLHAPVSREIDYRQLWEAMSSRCDELDGKLAQYEDARNEALEALEAAQRFIRNGIELGYIRMPDADTPDPAHRTPGLIDAAVRALKTQVDKGGERPAETSNNVGCSSLSAKSEKQDAETVVLPPLPKPVEQIGFLGGRPQDLFDIEKLRAFARTAVLDDRQQRAGDPLTAEAMAHLRTIANFGGTLEQAKALAAQGIRRCAALGTQEGEAC